MHLIFNSIVPLCSTAMAKTNVQCLVNKVEIDFEWELLTVTRWKQISIYWWQFEPVTAASSKCNLLKQQDGGGMKLPLQLYLSLNCFCNAFVASVVTSFFFCSVSDSWNERIDQAITESHINSGWFVQNNMGDRNSLLSTVLVIFIPYEFCHL